MYRFSIFVVIIFAGLVAATTARAQAAEPSAKVAASVPEIVIDGECKSATCKPTTTAETLTVTAKGFTGKLTYDYIVTGGRISGHGPTAAWDLAGVSPGTYMAIVTVTDENGHTATASTPVTVRACPCPPPTTPKQGQ
jgi:hypothetical protein